MDTRHNHTPNTSKSQFQSSTHLQNEHNLNTPRKTVAPEPVAYEEGYVHGRAAERSLDNQLEQDRSENSAARGLVLGIALASLVGLTAGALFYLNQRDESPTPGGVVAPASPQQPNRETTIIERRTENTQTTTPINQAPPTTSQPPDIRVIIPTPVQPQAPAPQNTTPQRQPSVEQPSIRQSNPSSETAPSSSQNQTSTGTSTTTEPSTTNPSSRTQSQNQTRSDRADTSDTSTSTTTQPNASNRTDAGQSQSPTGTTSGSSSSNDR